MQSAENLPFRDISNSNDCDPTDPNMISDGTKDELKERQRVTKACDNCRKKKIKCDADSEVCTSCKSLQIPCLFLDPTKKRGPPKGSGRNINAIEDRLHRMEAILGGLVREVEPPSMWDSPLANSLMNNSRDQSETDPHYSYEVQQQHRQRQLHLQQELDSILRSSGHSHSKRSAEEHVSDKSQQQQFAQPHQPQSQHYLPHQTQPQPQPQHQQQLQEQALHQQSRVQSQSLQQLFQQQQLRQSFSTESSQSPDMLDSSNDNFMLHESMWHNSSYPSPTIGHSGIDRVDSSSASFNLPRLGANTPPLLDISDLEEDVGHLSLDHTGHERYIGKSSPLFYSEIYHGTTVTLEREQERPEAQSFVKNPDLPSPEIMTHLLNLHFTFVHPFAPVMLWSKFLRRLRSKDYTPSFLFLLNCIFALSARFSEDLSFRSDPNLPETVGMVFAEKAKKILDTLYVSSDIHCVGGLILLSFQQMGSGGGYRAWMYVGIAVRMAQHLGLNRDCRELNKNMPILDREERDRVWWSCYMSDRFLATSFGRPQAINEHDVDATYPEGIDEEYTPLEISLEGAVTKLIGPQAQSEKNFVYLASLMRIQGRVMVSLYSPLSKASSTLTTSMTNAAPLEQLDKELTDWLMTLPAHLQFRSVQQEPGTFVCMLHMTFYSILILLHRPYSHQTSSDLPDHSSMSFSICTSAANNVIEIASNMMRNADNRGVARVRDLLHNSVFVFFTAGIIHVTNCTSSDHRLAASAKLRTKETMRCMDAIEDIWLTARFAAEILQRLLKIRNIELPGASDDFKSRSTNSAEVAGEVKELKDTQLPLAVPTPTDQFEFDVNQIMGYYQGSGRHFEDSLGRNSRHYTPPPYYSSSARRHHGPLGSYPGLSHGHSQQLRRPRQTKNSFPPAEGSSQSLEPSYSFATSFISMPTTEGLLPTPGQTDFVTESSIDISDFVGSVPMIMSGPPISMPLPTTEETVDILQLNSEVTPSNTSHNPFSSLLWDIPTSIDSDEWMLYMQNSGCINSTGAVNVNTGRAQARTSKTLDLSNGMFGSLAGVNSAVPAMDNNDMQATSYSAVSGGGGAHPFGQCLTRNELFAEE